MTLEQQQNIVSNVQAASTFLAKAIISASAVANEGSDALVTARMDFEQHLDCARAHFAAALDQRMNADEVR